MVGADAVRLFERRAQAAEARVEALAEENAGLLMELESLSREPPPPHVPHRTHAPTDEARAVLSDKDASGRGTAAQELLDELCEEARCPRCAKRMVVAVALLAGLSQADGAPGGSRVLRSWAWSGLRTCCLRRSSCGAL